VRELSRVLVFSPTLASRERFAESFRPTLDISAAASAEVAVQHADVVLCATRSRDESPVLRGSLLPPGVTVVSLGSTLPEQREVDEETMARAACIVADMPDEVAHDTGDGIAATRAGVSLADKLVRLAALGSGQVVPRRADTDIVLYKSVGSALQDVVIAEMLLDRARQRGLGVHLPASIVPVAK
jgi:ornithine cyclodeaminase/alanine dehydrogenase-like protein (mu-crystallin family)